MRSAMYVWTEPTRTGEHTYEREVSRPMRRTGPNGSQYEDNNEHSAQPQDDAKHHCTTSEEHL